MKIAIGSESIETTEIVVVGEYTTTEGPMIDDYFLVIVMKDGSVIELSMTDSAANQVLSEVSEGLAFPIRRGLANRTDFVSRIIYPQSLQEQPLFVPVKLQEGANGFWSKLQKKLPEDWVFAPNVVACTALNLPRFDSIKPGPKEPR